MKRPYRIQLLLCIALAGLFVSRLAWIDLRGSSRTREVPLRQSPAGDHKVVLVMIDGLRLQESYKFDRFESTRPARNYTPRLTSELIPSGTLYPNAFTGAFNTITTAATNTIVTGSWHEGPNRGRGAESSDEDFVDNRSFDRTIFELARRELGLADTDVVFISNKLNTRLSDYSYHPLGGKQLGPQTHVFQTRFNQDEAYKEETWIDPTRNSDRSVLDKALEVIDSLEPRLLFVSFGNVDIAGHRSTKDERSDYRFYTRSIELWDHLIASLWNEIQRRPAYRENTTLILCSDHGRHEDHDIGAYGSHQGTCEGTRNIMCLVVGPYTTPGAVVDRRVYQTAFVPTIGALLGCRAPEATGQPLYEAIGLVPEVDGPRYARNMKTTIDGSTIVAAYRRGDGHGNDQIVVRTARGADPFDAPRVVASSRWDGATFHDLPDVAVDNGEVHVAAWRWTDENHEVVHWSSKDGRRFDGERVLATGKTEDSRFGEISLRGFELLVTNGTSHLILPAIAQPGAGNGSILTQIESIRYGEGARKTRRDRIDRPRRIGHHRWLDVVATSDGGLHAAFAALDLPTDDSIRPLRSTWEIFVKGLSDSSADDAAIRLTDNNTVPDVMPALAVHDDGGGRLEVVYASFEKERFQLFLTGGSLESASAFSTPVRITESELGAWQPDAVAVDGGIHVVWIDFDYGNGDVLYAVFRDGQRVGSVENLSRTASISRNPQILAEGDTGRLHVVWEEEDHDLGFRIEKRTLSLPSR